MGFHINACAARIALASCLLPLASCLLVACGGQGGVAERLNRDGNRAYAAGDYENALDSYRRAAAERPDLTEVVYNTGNALYRLGRYDPAIAESQKAAASGSNDTRFRAYYTIGNAFARQGKWREAYESYRNALVLNPADHDAKYNLELALRRLAEQQQEQQARRQNQQNQQGQQNQQAQPQGQQQGQGQQDQQGQSQQGQQQPSQQGGQQQAGGQPNQAPPGGQSGRPVPGQDLKDALAQFERTISIEDALRILDLIAQQQAQRSQIPAPPPGSTIRDQ